MTTSLMPSFLTEVYEGKPIPEGKLEYFRERLRSRFHQLVLGEFLRQEDRGLTQAELAKRIGKRPDVLNRLLGAPGNWTLNTVSDLLIGMGVEPELDIHRFQPAILQLEILREPIQSVFNQQPQEVKADSTLEQTIASLMPVVAEMERAHDLAFSRQTAFSARTARLPYEEAS